ncbi:hypothetical protein RSO41_14075 [Halomonas sp. I1]|uniref:hypothetical protein n=1 Tax=Halomonas sp. I1 TaxID=393536 RepID=UPI0028DF86C9|nr:hypothetical protein [Halomonas sp. I1]MDT8895781.1 hypothetical protein [Halomonas sp. I1]
MPSRGGRNVRRNMRRLSMKIRGPVTEKAVTEILIIGEGYAVNFTPVDTSHLINSRSRLPVVTGPSGTRGTVVYTAKYAAAVHEAPGTLKGQPRPKKNGRSRGNYWSPNGEPGFLEKGFEEAKPEIRGILRKNYRPR